MVDAILLFNEVFSDDDDSDYDEYEFWVDNGNEGEDVVMEDVDEDEDEDEDDGRNVTWRMPIHCSDYVEDEGYEPYQKRRYAGNKDTGWDLLLEEHADDAPLRRHFYENFGMRQEGFYELVEQARAATKVNEEGERVHRFVDELNDVKWRPKPIKLRDKVGAILHYMRQNCLWDSLSHLVNISPEVLRMFFYEFIDWISEDKYHEEVYFPRNAAERDRIESCYARVGFPGCIGSTDGVHMSKMIPIYLQTRVTNSLLYYVPRDASGLYQPRTLRMISV